MCAEAHNPALSADRHHFVALDGFRGVLALFVAVYHTIWLSWPNSTAFLDNGAVIIDLFFAFSGFLMFTLYGGLLQRRGAVRDFMIRRFARLMPLHLFMLAVFVGFSVLRLLAHHWGIAHQDAGEILPFEAGAVESARNLLAHLTLTHAMSGADQLAFNPPSWTVGAEFYTYILFAALMVAWGTRKIGWGAMAGLGLIVASIYAYIWTQKPDLNITYDLGFLRCVAGFFTGVIAAFWVKTNPINFGRFATYAEAFTLIGATLFVIYCPGKAQFFVAPILLIFIAVFSSDAGLISKGLGAPVFGFLAKISYSVYLTHVIIAIGFEIAFNIVLGPFWPEWSVHHGFGTLLLVPYLVVVIAVSTLTYHGIERPGGRWVRSVMRRRPVKRAMPIEGTP